MVSVIVPFWNAEKWLGRCLESLLWQGGDLEFLLVDDNSTDNGAEIAAERTVGDGRFVLLRNEGAKGVSGARNTGLDAARGEWIAFLDVDDELLPDAGATFERMSRKNANVIQTNHLRHYAKWGKTVQKYTNAPGVYGLDRLPECWCMVWNKLYRRSFLEDIRFVEGLQYGEDEVFNLECLAKDDLIIHTKTPTVLRNFDNKESLSRIKGPKDLLTQAKALEDFLMRTENPRARVAVCRIMSEHWGSPRYMKRFGADYV